MTVRNVKAKNSAQSTFLRIPPFTPHSILIFQAFSNAIRGIFLAVLSNPTQYSRRYSRKECARHETQEK